MFFFNRKKNKKQQQEEAAIDEQNQSKDLGSESVEEGHEENYSEEDKKAEDAEAAEDNKQEMPEERQLSAMALFKDKVFDMEAVKEHMKKRADLTIEVQEEAEHPSFIVKTDEGTFVCTHFSTPVPHGEVQSDLKVNAVEKQTVQDIQNHQAFIMITRMEMPYKNRLDAYVTFTKIASVLMMQPNAAGMYIDAARYIISPQRYCAFMGQIMQAEDQGERFFPYPLWIKTTILMTEKGAKAVTCGLNAFGLYELGFAETKRSPEEIFKILMNLCEMYLVEKCQFQDGDSMRLDPKTEAVFKLEKETLYIVEA